MVLYLQDFLHGAGFEEWVWRNSRFPITCSFGNNSLVFHLLVSFGRCVVRLNMESAGFLLQSFISGSTDGFRIVPLSDRVFIFSISCKEVGFTVYGMRSYECESQSIHAPLESWWPKLAQRASIVS